MGTHFVAPDAREFSADIGVQDAICALHGCSTARISEALLLLGDVDGALAYTSDDVMSMAELLKSKGDGGCIELCGTFVFVCVVALFIVRCCW